MTNKAKTHHYMCWTPLYVNKHKTTKHTNKTKDLVARNGK